MEDGAAALRVPVDVLDADVADLAGIVRLQEGDGEEREREGERESERAFREVFAFKSQFSCCSSLYLLLCTVLVPLTSLYCLFLS